MTTNVSIEVKRGNALEIDCDVLVLKHAQALYGVDEAAVSSLKAARLPVAAALPKPGMFSLISTGGALGARAVLFVGVPSLSQLDYAGIREFGARALASLSGAKVTKHVALTVHGPNYGLDESESFRAELAGLLDSLERGDCPESLERITIVERDPGRATRLTAVLDSSLPSGSYVRPGRSDATALSDARRSLADVGEGSRQKPRIFAAMPFAKEFDDRFHYGIQRAAEASGFLCERADLTPFLGDVLGWVRDRIASASFVVADLTTANPNVYLEVGYAWGRNVPTVLLVSEATELRFDARSQRCLVYEGSIRQLEELLTTELKALAAAVSESRSGGRAP
jgi:hypothetical protein